MISNIFAHLYEIQTHAFSNTTRDKIYDFIISTSRVYGFNNPLACSGQTEEANTLTSLPIPYKVNCKKTKKQNDDK